MDKENKKDFSWITPELIAKAEELIKSKLGTKYELDTPIITSVYKFRGKYRIESGMANIARKDWIDFDSYEELVEHIKGDFNRLFSFKLDKEKNKELYEIVESFNENYKELL